ncbi:FOXG [Mytilus edulis]|uniref:FOXG n=1 Tax=Mytilus edulis TaxID=6550 RepID=A0A8S3SFY6_MYTED|nr:FOXG [Mytilus edulis]
MQSPTSTVVHVSIDCLCQHNKMACCQKYKKWKSMKHNIVSEINHNLGVVHGTLEGKCETIGFKICEKINTKECTLDQALDAIVEFSRDCATRENEIQMAWLSIHLALGLCFEYKVSNKATIRRFLKEVLLYSRGIDMGLFMRDILHYDDLSSTNEAAAKSLYCLSFTAGFMVDMVEDGLGDKIFVGPARVVYSHLARAQKVNYLDLPIGHPTLTMTTKAAISSYVPSTPLGLACESLKPNVVLTLLRYGCSPIGKPIDFLILTLGSQKVVEQATGLKKMDTPLENVKLCFEYCLRAVRSIKVRIGEETTADTINDRGQEHVHFVRETAADFIPDDCYKTPAKLKHLARCEIRDTMFAADREPVVIYQLPIVDSYCKKYIDLML